MSIRDQKLVIVGGTSGIGLATAHAALAIGAEVVIVGRDSEKLDGALAALGSRATGSVVDAGNRADMDAFLAGVGRFDHLVIAASGGSGAGPLSELTRQTLQNGLDAKFWVQWNAAQAALPFLTRQGSITFVTAASSRVGTPNTSGLAAINGALQAMILPLAHELGPIRVNAVSPGVIETPWWDNQPPSFKQRFFRETAESVPAGRVGTAEEVADAIVFVAGNAYVTGVVLDVDGGMRGAQPN